MLFNPLNPPLRYFDLVTGEDFNRNLGIADLDFATIHVYPNGWAIPADSFDWVNDNYIRPRAVLAVAAGKPLLLEVRLKHLQR